MYPYKINMQNILLNTILAKPSSDPELDRITWSAKLSLEICR